MFPLLLSVKRKNRAPVPSAEFTHKVTTRDGHVCQFCELTDVKNTIVAEELSLDQAFTADILCAAYHELDLVKTGVMIYLPGVSRTVMNHFIRTIYIAMAIGDPDEREEAAEVLAQLKNLSSSTEKQWGTASARQLGTLLKKAPDEVYAKRETVLAGLVLLLHPACIPKQMVKSWVENVRDKGLGQVDSWKIIFEGQFSNDNNAIG